MDLYRRLVIFCCAEGFALACWNGRITLDQSGRHATQRLHSQRERRDIKQEDVLPLTLEHARLDGRADGHYLVRVHPLVRFLAEDLAHQLNHCWHAGLSTDQHNLIDIARPDTGILQRLHDRATRALDQIADQLLQFGPRQGHHQVLGSTGVSRDERQVDLGLHRRREFDLGSLCRFLQALECHAIVTQINSLVFAELVGQPVNDAMIEVISAQVRIAVGRLDLKDPLTQLQDGDIEGPTTEVIHGNGLVFLLVQPIGQRGSCWLVDNTQYLEPGNRARIFGRLALRVVEVGRHRNHGLGNLLAQFGFRIDSHLLQNHRPDFRWAVFASTHHYTNVPVGGTRDLIGHTFYPALDLGVIVLAPHETLNGKNRIFGVGHRLSFRHLTDQPLTVLGDGYHGGREARPLAVLQHGRLTSLHDRHHRVGGSQAHPNYFAHSFSLPSFQNSLSTAALLDNRSIITASTAGIMPCRLFFQFIVQAFHGRDLRYSGLLLHLGEHLLACGSASVLPLAYGRRSARDTDLSRTNDTFSQGIPWLGNVQDRSFRHICSRLRRDGLMPARIERLSGCADLSHAQLVEQRRESSRNQEQALHPGVLGQLWWCCSQRPS